MAKDNNANSMFSPIAMNSAKPIDHNSYFESYAEAVSAAESAIEAYTSGATCYYIGQKFEIFLAADEYEKDADGNPTTTLLKKAGSYSMQIQPADAAHDNKPWLKESGGSVEIAEGESHLEIKDGKLATKDVASALTMKDALENKADLVDGKVPESQLPAYRKEEDGNFGTVDVNADVANFSNVNTGMINEVNISKGIATLGDDGRVLQELLPPNREQDFTAYYAPNVTRAGWTNHKGKAKVKDIVVTNVLSVFVTYGNLSAPYEVSLPFNAETTEIVIENKDTLMIDITPNNTLEPATASFLLDIITPAT